MTKKILLSLYFIFLTGITLLYSTAFAQNAQQNDTKGEISSQELFHSFTYGENLDGAIGSSISYVEAVNKLPKASWQKTITSIIKILLNISGALSLLSFTIGGAMLVLANGKTEIIDKGKKIVMYSLIGLLTIAVSYAVVIGVSELTIFTAGR